MSKENPTQEEIAMEAKMATNLGKMEVDSWPNLVLLVDSYWFISDQITSSSRCGNETFLEFELPDNVDYQFLKNRYPIGKCLNGAASLRNRLSVNARNILSIQQYEG